MKVAKYHDYFTSCLTAPQKGDAVEIPVGSSSVPIRTSNTDVISWASGTSAMILKKRTDGTISANKSLSTDSNGNISANNTTPGSFIEALYPTNLYADLTEAYATTINVLREAFAAQKILERDARGGTRYTEIIKSHFGVTSPDARMQRPYIS